MPLTNTFTDASDMATVHAQHHNALAIQGLYLKVRSTAAQSIPNNTLTPLTFNAIDYDRVGGFTAGANSYTPGIAGWWELTGAMGFLSTETSGTAGGRAVQWVINGGAVLASSVSWQPANTLSQAFPARTFPVLLTATDTVGMAVTQTSGATISTVSGAATSLQAFMAVKYLGPA